MITRRALIARSCCGLVAGQASYAAATPNARGGCDALDTAAINALKNLASSNTPTDAAALTSGDARFDSALGFVLADLASRFSVRPGFTYFDDSASPNAYATAESKIEGTRGTVLLGLTLVRGSLADRSRGDLFLMSVCAHEFAHVLQKFTPYAARLLDLQTSVKRLELHADFMAGYYLSMRNRMYSPNELYSLGPAWASLGDSNYADPNHHGTPDERISAIQMGFKIGTERPAFDALDMCEVGARYLETLG